MTTECGEKTGAGTPVTRGQLQGSSYRIERSSKQLKVTVFSEKLGETDLISGHDEIKLLRQ
jgi:hypothetical protein